MRAGTDALSVPSFTFFHYKVVAEELLMHHNEVY